MPLSVIAALNRVQDAIPYEMRKICQPESMNLLKPAGDCGSEAAMTPVSDYPVKCNGKVTGQSLAKTLPK